MKYKIGTYLIFHIKSNKKYKMLKKTYKSHLLAKAGMDSMDPTNEYIIVRVMNNSKHTLMKWDVK